MEPRSGDEPYITWAPHPDPAVERMFREANRAGYVICQVEGLYMLVTPDGLADHYFVGRVVPSSGIWQHMVAELRDWPAETAGRAPEGQV